MKDVQFEEHDESQDKRVIKKKDLEPSTMGTIVVDSGIANTQRQANHILIAIAVIFFILSFIVIAYRETVRIGLENSKSTNTQYK